MRYLILVVCAGVTLSTQTVRPPSVLDKPMDGTVGSRTHRAQPVPPLDGPRTAGAAGAGADRLRADAGLQPGPVGVAAVRRIAEPGRPHPRQAIDRVLSKRPDYRWAEVDGVAVIRPVTAWAPSGSVLNAPVAPFVVADEHPHHALHTVFQATQPPLFQEHTDLLLSSNGRRHEDRYATTLIDAPVSVRFAGGNAVQALNAITREFGGLWQAAYTPRGDHRRSLWVALYTSKDGGVTNLSSAAFTIPADTPH